MQDIVRRYYRAWAAQDRDAAAACLAEDLDFRSPQDRFGSRQDFLSKCWNYSTGLTRVEFLRELYVDDQAFVILAWHGQDGGRFVGAEYLRIQADRITEILVVNNDPGFADLVG